MKKKRSASSVEQIPLDKITVINPRARNRKVFEGIVKNIRQLGLKRPITVIRKTGVMATASISSAGKDGSRRTEP